MSSAGSLAIFPDNVAVDSDNFTTVTSPWVLGRSNRKSGNKAASILAASIQSTTDAIKSQVAENRRRARTEDRLRGLEQEAYELGLKMLDVGQEDDPHYQCHKKHKLELESKIEKMKESLELELLIYIIWICVEKYFFAGSIVCLTSDDIMMPTACGKLLANLDV